MIALPQGPFLSVDRLFCPPKGQKQSTRLIKRITTAPLGAVVIPRMTLRRIGEESSGMLIRPDRLPPDGPSGHQSVERIGFPLRGKPILRSDEKEKEEWATHLWPSELGPKGQVSWTKGGWAFGPSGQMPWDQGQRALWALGPSAQYLRPDPTGPKAQ